MKPSFYRHVIVTLTLFCGEVFTGAAEVVPVIVNTTAETGNGSFTAAITTCNAIGGNAVVRFVIPKTVPDYDSTTETWTIRLTDTPPSLSVSGVLIDGPVSRDGKPQVLIDGVDHSVEYALQLVDTKNVTVRGLAVCRFLYGIQIYGRNSSNNAVYGCYLGTDGDRAKGNYVGVEMISGTSGNRIGSPLLGDRNVVSGNEHIGIRISDANGNQVVNNLVGVDRTGSKSVPNHDGICVEGKSTGNVIGGAGENERNIVSGNIAYGVDLFGAGVRKNLVIGNYIGTDIDGTAAIPNTYGVLFDDRSSENRVGGLEKGEGNLISGNTAFGGYFYNNGTCRNEMIGNRIGTDATGTKAIPNETGIHIDGGTFENLVDSNLVSGNLVAGITIFSIVSDRNVIVKNKIGTDISGNNRLGNGEDGIRIAFGPQENVIGGKEEKDGNVIAFNGRHGIMIESEGNVPNRIGENDIHDNAEEAVKR